MYVSTMVLLGVFSAAIATSSQEPKLLIEAAVSISVPAKLSRKRWWWWGTRTEIETKPVALDRFL